MLFKTHSLFYVENFCGAQCDKRFINDLLVGVFILTS